MKIGGLLPLSLSDYPGHVAAIVFTQGCNFRCPFCHNGRLIDESRQAGDLLREEEVFDTLTSRRKHLDGVVVSGGEPTLQSDLPKFIHGLKELGYAVKLDTNGSRPGVVRNLLVQGLVDFIAMDIKAPLSRYDDLTGVVVDAAAIRESIDLLANSGVEHEFRTTAVWPMLSEEDMDRIRELVPAGSPYRVQPFQPEHAQAEWLRQTRSVSRSHYLERSRPLSINSTVKGTIK